MKLYQLVPTAIITTLSITGCASISSVSTNLDQENFTQYFSPTQVKILESEAQFPARAKMLGMVEGEACQVKAHHAAPDKIDARTDARRKAYQLGANTIVFSGCALIEANKSCYATLVCYGKAYYLESTAE
jgi:RcsF protein